MSFDNDGDGRGPSDSMTLNADLHATLYANRSLPLSFQPISHRTPCMWPSLL